MPPKKRKPEGGPDPEIIGSLGTGKQSTPSKDLFPSILQLSRRDALSRRDIEGGHVVFGDVGSGKTKPQKTPKKRQARKTDAPPIRLDTPS